mgnify:CR=1 FL=1
MSKVSIIVPIYGVENFLRECVDSILNQSIKDIEIILIDDGGKDNCPQIIDEYAQKDNRIIAIHKPNGGYGQTCNVGLERATGEYVAIVEPDDYIDSKMYEDLYNIACKFNSDIVKSCFYDNLQAKQEQRILKTKWNDFIPENKSFKIEEYPFFLYYHPSIWSCIYKREFLQKNNIKFIEAPGAGWTDNPFQVQTMCLAERINYTSNAYYYWRRLNSDESKDLKDYTIPFKRTNEIHKWLENNNINNEGVLVNLFRREIAYANIVIGMKKLVNLEDAYEKINELISRCPKTFCNCKYVRQDELKTYWLLKNNPKLARTKMFLKKLRKNIVSIRWNRHEKRIVLLGKNLIKV